MSPTASTLSPELDLRQLRHQTKNALTRILAQIACNLPPTSASQRLAADVENRVLLTAQISDALFGLTRAPGPWPDRLRSLCEGVVALMGDPDQSLRLQCRSAGTVPGGLQEVVLRIAHEFLGNAVRHGMHMRLTGRIDVSVEAGADGLALSVEDDGWGWISLCEGEGLGVARALAANVGGTIGLRRDGDRTMARFTCGSGH